MEEEIIKQACCAPREGSLLSVLAPFPESTIGRRKMEEAEPDSHPGLSSGHESADERSDGNDGRAVHAGSLLGAPASATAADKNVAGRDPGDSADNQNTTSQIGNSKPTATTEAENVREQHLAEDHDDGDDDAAEEEGRLADAELRLVRRMRLAFEASLRMLEAARDDLEEMGDRMDRLARASELCRGALRDKKEREDGGPRP
jgi:hypothetical protein